LAGRQAAHDGEDNRDGADENFSANYGVEGPTDDPEIIALRDRQKRNFLATLFLSQGVPMLCGGDEICRTQGGNNNAYCQDNEISWFDWDLGDQAQQLLDFTRRVVQVRSEQPVLRRRKFFRGRPIRGSEVKDLTWFRPDGEEMTDADWEESGTGALALRLAGDAIDEHDARGNRIVGDTLLILVNGRPNPVTFKLPDFGPRGNVRWQVMIDTADPTPESERLCEGGSLLRLADRSLVLCRRLKLGPTSTR
jgi:isoamylase